MSSFGRLGSMGYGFFQRATKILQTKELEVLKYVEEESKQSLELDVEKCDTGWCLFPNSIDVLKFTFACR
jgi:hypothetical protein